MSTKALQALCAAIRENGNPKITWCLDDTLSTFWALWAKELRSLEDTGTCEIPARFTLSGLPEKVTVER